MIDTTLFPHQNHPVRLEVLLENRIAWFQDDFYLQKYITSTKLKSKDIKVLYRDEKPTKSIKAKQKSLQQGTAESGDGGTSRPRRNTKDLDAGGIIRGSNKSKPKSK